MCTVLELEKTGELMDQDCPALRSQGGTRLVALHVMSGSLTATQLISYWKACKVLGGFVGHFD